MNFGNEKNQAAIQIMAEATEHEIKQAPQPLAKPQDEIFGSFHIGTMEVAINVKAIQEVVNLPERLIAMPLAPDFLVGVFNLRGIVIPIINLKKLLKFDESDTSLSQKVGIINHEGAKIGLLFDSTSEIIRVGPQLMNEFAYNSEKSHKVISGAIKLENGKRILQVINPFALLQIENIPQITSQQAKAPERIRRSYHLDDQKKCISFLVKEIKLAFDIAGIHEIIKAPEIQKSAIENKICIGIVNLRGHTIPVIDLGLVLGTKTADDVRPADQKIIVLKLGEELFGLLVDSVASINSYATTDIMPIPLFSSERSKIFLGYVSLKDLGDVMLLNYQEILSSQEIFEVTQGHSRIYKRDGAAAKSNAKSKMNRESYISFKLEHLFGVSIKDIREIINYTDDVISAPGMPSFVKGVLNLRGRLITIIDTRQLYKMAAVSNLDSQAKILIFDTDDERFGLIVDSVESIITVDEEKKMKVPNLMTQAVQDKFGNDIKEIITCHQFGQTDGSVLIILNMNPVKSRIKAA